MYSCVYNAVKKTVMKKIFVVANNRKWLGEVDTYSVITTEVSYANAYQTSTQSASEKISVHKRASQ